jgi:hypothetical protein
MSGDLFSDGFEMERFYPQTVREFDDLLGAMMLSLPEDEGLRNETCINQLLKGSDGRFIQLFGGLNRIRDKLDDGTFQELSRGICAAFYRLKWGQYDEYCTAIRHLEETVRDGVHRKRTANDA